MSKVNINYGLYAFDEMEGFVPLQKQCNIQYNEDISTEEVKHTEQGSFFLEKSDTTEDMVTPQCECLKH